MASASLSVESILAKAGSTRAENVADACPPDRPSKGRSLSVSVRLAGSSIRLPATEQAAPWQRTLEPSIRPLSSATKLSLPLLSPDKASATFSVALVLLSSGHGHVNRPARTVRAVDTCRHAATVAFCHACAASALNRRRMRRETRWRCRLNVLWTAA